MREELDILEGSCDPFFGDLIGFEVSDLFSFEKDLSGIRRIDSTDAIKDGGFSGSIRSNNRINRTLFHFKVYVIESFDSPKGNGQVFYFEDRVHNFKKNSNRAGEALASPFTVHAMPARRTKL